MLLANNMISQLQHKYEFESSETKTPMATSFNDITQNKAEKCDNNKYLTLLGELLYISKIRFDITFALSRLAVRQNYATTKEYI